MCFDLKDQVPEPAITGAQQVPMHVGDVFKIREGLWGAWQGEKRYIPSGTEVLVLNVMTSHSGELRAMVQCAPDGDTLWCSGALLQKYRGQPVAVQQGFTGTAAGIGAFDA
jgi:hypothetical protein